MMGTEKIPLRGKDVVLLGGNDCIARSIEHMLQVDGAHVSHCTDEEPALNRILELRPDIILLDTATPGCTVWTFCEQLRKRPEVSGTPIVFVNRSGRPVERRRARLLGANALIAIPFQHNDLLALLSTTLSIETEV